MGDLGEAYESARRVYVTETGLCVGCQNCQLVCTLVHEGASGLNLARIYVDKNLFTGAYKVMTCDQCSNAPCVAACPVENALILDPVTGAKTIDSEKCIGCQSCQEACIHSASRSRIVFDAKRNICLVCDLCGGDPQCIQVCPVRILDYRESAGPINQLDCGKGEP